MYADSINKQVEVPFSLWSFTACMSQNNYLLTVDKTNNKINQ